MKMIDVKSSNIRAVGYNKTLRELRVQFIGKKGKEDKTYSFKPVSENLYKSLMEASSIGSFFANNIKDNKEIKFKRI